MASSAKRPSALGLQTSASAPQLDIDVMYPPEAFNQLPLRARIALTPLQLTAYLGSRQPPLPPPQVPPQHEKIDFVQTFHLRRPGPTGPRPPNVRKLGGSPSAKELSLVTAYRSDIHATLPPSPALQQHTVKPKPARTAVEVRAEAVEQILAAQRATSPIREHIERRRRAQAAAAKAIDDFRKATEVPPLIPPITAPLPEPRPRPPPQRKVRKATGLPKRPKYPGEHGSVAVMRANEKTSAAAALGGLRITTDEASGDGDASCTNELGDNASATAAAATAVGQSAVDADAADEDDENEDDEEEAEQPKASTGSLSLPLSDPFAPMHKRHNSRALMHANFQFAVEAPLWYEPAPAETGTPLLVAPTPLSPSYARRKSAVAAMLQSPLLGARPPLVREGGEVSPPPPLALVQDAVAAAANVAAAAATPATTSALPAKPALPSISSILPSSSPHFQPASAAATPLPRRLSASVSPSVAAPSSRPATASSVAAAAGGSSAASPDPRPASAPIAIVMAPHTPLELRPLTGDPARPPPPPPSVAAQLANFPTPVQQRNLAVSAQVAAYQRADHITFDFAPTEHTTQRYFGVFEGQEGPKTLAVRAGHNPALPVYKDAYLQRLIDEPPRFWCVGQDEARQRAAAQSASASSSPARSRAASPAHPTSTSTSTSTTTKSKSPSPSKVSKATAARARTPSGISSSRAAVTSATSGAPRPATSMAKLGHGSANASGSGSGIGRGSDDKAAPRRSSSSLSFSFDAHESRHHAHAQRDNDADAQDAHQNGDGGDDDDVDNDDEAHLPSFMRSRSLKGHLRHPHCRDVVSAHAPPAYHPTHAHTHAPTAHARPPAPAVPVTPFNFLEKMRQPDYHVAPAPVIAASASSPPPLLSPVAHARVLAPPPPPPPAALIAAAATRIQRLVRRFLARKHHVDAVKTANPYARARGEARLLSAERQERERRATLDRAQSPLKSSFTDFCGLPRSLNNPLKSAAELADAERARWQTIERQRAAAAAAMPPRTPVTPKPSVPLSPSMLPRPKPVHAPVAAKTPTALHKSASAHTLRGASPGATTPLGKRAPASPLPASTLSPHRRTHSPSAASSSTPMSSSAAWFAAHVDELPHRADAVETIVEVRPSLAPLLLSDEARALHAERRAMQRRVHDHWEAEHAGLRARVDAAPPRQMPRSPSPERAPWKPL